MAAGWELAGWWIVDLLCHQCYGDAEPAVNARRGGGGRLVRSSGMVLQDVVGFLGHPVRTATALRDGRPLPGSVAAVVGAGVLTALLAAAATALEPGVSGAAGYGISAVLPVLFTAVWLIDATIIDAVAQLMGAPTRLRPWMSVSALAVPSLCAFDALRVVQALIDRTGAVDVGTGVGFLGFVVLGWFLALTTLACAAVYDLPRLSAFSAALAPPAAMATVLLVLLVIGSVLAGGTH